MKRFLLFVLALCVLCCFSVAPSHACPPVGVQAFGVHGCGQPNVAAAFVPVSSFGGHPQLFVVQGNGHSRNRVQVIRVQNNRRRGFFGAVQDGIDGFLGR